MINKLLKYYWSIRAEYYFDLLTDDLIKCEAIDFAYYCEALNKIENLKNN